MLWSIRESVWEEGKRMRKPNADQKNKKARDQSYYRVSLSILKKNRLAMFCLFIVILLVLIAVFAPYLTPYDPNLNDVRNRFQSPSMEHPFGTDEYGRDILTRVFFGCRISLSVGIVSQLIASLLGYFIGVLAGYYGGKVDSVLSFIIQVFSSFPFLLFAIAVMFILGPGLINLYIALGLLGWTSTARLVRGEVMRLKNSEYIQSCIVGGGSGWRIIMKHLLPNCVPTLIITITMGIPRAILSEASLSFLGLGVSPPTASWGAMISHAQPYIRKFSYYSLFPGLAIIVCVLAFNLLGDGLRDALDPKLKQ